MHTLEMPQGQLKGSLGQESASDRLCGVPQSSPPYYCSPAMSSALVTLLELPFTNKSRETRQDALSPIPSDAEFQYVTPQSLTISQSFPEIYDCPGPEQPSSPSWGHHKGQRNDLITPSQTIQTPRIFREATCFRKKRLNLSGPSCVRVFLLQRPPEPGPAGVTQTAHSGYVAST